MYADGLLEGLNDEQRAVAQFDGGPLRVLAGAGTGKTTALSARVARIVADGVPAERVLLLTFTRRAARQMVERSHARLARIGYKSGRVSGGTFHSVAHRTLRQHAARLGLPEGFSVLDPADAADVMDVVRDETLKDLPGGRRVPRKSTLLDIYSRAVDTGTPVADVVNAIAPWASDLVEPIGAVCAAYLTRKRRLGLLDFDDLLLHWRQALRDDLVGRSLGGMYDHVLVDEYQDVNALQVELLQLLRRHDDRITVVGDDAQAIYSFRASDPRHILDFEADFAGATTLQLTVNYRSTQAILDTANTLADDAPAGFSTRLRAAAPAPATLPRMVRCADEDHQSQIVCEEVLAQREAGVALQEQAVLVRAAHHSDRLEIELGRRGIPFVKYGGLRYLEAAHVKDLLAAFRIADNPRDEVAWFRVLQLLPGVGPTKAKRALTALGLLDDGEDAEVLLRWPLALNELPAGAQEAAEAVARAVATKQADPLRQAMAPLIRAAYDNGEERLADLDVLVEAAATLPRLSDVAADHALDPPRSTGDLAGAPAIDEDWLVISTMHSAKGLEWDVVHVIHAADGNIPSDMALTDRNGLEEERRLFYVAVTRARHDLNVYVPLRYHHRPTGDRHSWSQPSRFLSDAVRATMTEQTLLRPESGDPADIAVVDTTSAVDAELRGLFG
ncbi:MAG: ATP-dependent helicase [Micrococcales bacterium]|nr:ATP-dependent helicase [Micrococcales bacterium]